MNIELRSGPIRLYRILGQTARGRTYHAVFRKKEVVFKFVCAEFESSGQNGVGSTQLVENNYHRLKEIGIPLPELIDVDREHDLLIKDFIPGMSAAELIADGLPSRGLLTQLFAIASTCRAAGITLDFFPANFVISSGRLHYISYTVFPYSPEMSLENRGLYYWANTAGMRTFLRNGSYRLVHEPGEGNEPLRTPFASIVRSWIKEFA
jgi:hypothetical protein